MIILVWLISGLIPLVWFRHKFGPLEWFEYAFGLLFSLLGPINLVGFILGLAAHNELNFKSYWN